MTKTSPARINRRLQSDNRMVHKLIKKTSQELAGAFYEFQASHSRLGDEFYKAFPSVNRFVESEWPSFVKTTREVLARMLGDPTTSDIEKADIYEALCLDATLPYSHQNVQVTNFRH